LHVVVYSPKLFSQHKEVDAHRWLPDEIPVKIEHEPGLKRELSATNPDFPSVTSVRCFPFFARVSRTEATVSTAAKDQE
jgi:hypothetical protein